MPAAPSSFRVDDGLSVTVESPDSPDARRLLDELSDELLKNYGSDGRASFADWQENEPSYIFLIARFNGEPVGCGGVRPIADGVGEIKRMFAKHRGRAIGSAILNAIEREAADAGYHTLWLETRIANSGAVAFYRARGYRQRENFGKYVGNSQAICFEKTLR